VIDWKENEREWEYALPQVSAAEYKVSYYITSMQGISEVLGVVLI
jgi:hypothetical protein